MKRFRQIKLYKCNIDFFVILILICLIKILIFVINNH